MASINDLIYFNSEIILENFQLEFIRMNLNLFYKDYFTITQHILI